MTGWFKRLFAPAGPGVGQLGPQEAQALAAAGAVILDVRTPLERQAARIPGSRAMPLDTLPDKWEGLPADREIICQCASGSRSRQAAHFLAARGLKVHNLRGGLSAWQAAGLPVKRG
ncbi:MAG TPA: rhodanese-like domain-containing protein [Deinococcales bacterium]|nr:rhodanese-like domain-containing protein [Deinococcales bacterium]